MQFRNTFFPLFIFILLTTSAHAEENYRNQHLTPQEIQRVTAVKGLLGSVDTKSLRETINELEKTRHPQINIQMREAMARTYVDIAQEFKVEGQKKKEWLYSMVCLNMAYFQFGGTQGKSGSTTELNRLIRQKLKEYLPPNALTEPGFFYSLE